MRNNYATKIAKKLANIYYNAGYKEVEAKTGIHKGTYKVFVNFIPIADITYMEKSLFNNIRVKIRNWIVWLERCLWFVVIYRKRNINCKSIKNKIKI